MVQPGGQNWFVQPSHKILHDTAHCVDIVARQVRRLVPRNLIHYVDNYSVSSWNSVDPCLRPTSRFHLLDNCGKHLGHVRGVARRELG